MTKLVFVTGLLVGFVMAGALGYVLQKRRVAKAKMGASKRPQTVALKTDKTPEEVVKSSRIAGLDFVLWTMAVALVLLGFIWLTFRVFLFL